jgi:hypothetical protein
MEAQVCDIPYTSDARETMATPEDCPMVQIPEKDRRKWHINKSVEPATIITAVVALAAFIWWAMGQEGRMTKEEQATIRHDKEIVEIKENAKADRAEIKQDIKEILKKLDEGKSRR